MIFDAMARHQSGRVLSAKVFRKLIKVQQSPASGANKSDAPAGAADSRGRFPTLKEAEQQHIDEALRRANNNQGIAATLLGISRPALNRRLARAARNKKN